MTRGAVGRRAALLSAGLVLAAVPVPGAVAAQGAAPVVKAAPGERSGPAPKTVTLVTGDQVTVTGLGHGRKTVTVERPPGATGAVRTQASDGDLTVVPDEALPYLRSGKLDRRLFDVSALIRQGLTDTRAGSLPLIVGYGEGTRVPAAAPAGTTRTRSLPSLRGAAVEAGKGRTFWRSFTRGDGVDRVWLDGRVTADMAGSNAQIGTRAAWDAGLTGKGVTVAVLDSGADLTHPDLVDRIGRTASFVDGEEVADRDGHGTHVTSTVGGSGAASGGKEKGVAPDATLAVGKVLSDAGSGSESQIIAGMEWAARDVRARIVSMSLGSSDPGDGTDPMSQALDSLSRETGALFVVAAGNTGAPSSISSPGAADAALTVGAVDPADRPASFTSAGPRAGDDALKPDLSAPGVDILAARSQLTDGSGYYTTMSGTSMATPHVAGVAALLAQEHPDWTGAQLKDALMSTSERLGFSAYTVGAGQVSVPDAVRATVTATGSADLGFHRWPYPANKPVTRTLTYTNSGDQAVHLTLSAQGAPDGVATLADSSLTVPAHGTATTTVTGDGAQAPVGTTSGQIVAADDTGAVRAHTVFGLVKEDERYTLTVHVKDRAGAPAAADLTVRRLAPDADPESDHVDGSGTLELRLKPGTYALTSFLDVHGSHGADSLGLGFLAAPEITLDHDREVTLDGTRLREIKAAVPRRTETHQLLMEYDRAANGADLSGAVQVPLAYDSVFAAPTPPVTKGSFEYRTVWRLAKPRLEVRGIGEATVQSGGTLTAGRRRLPLVDAGDGPVPASAAGKAVLARLADGADPPALARAAQDAGAKALFVTDDAPGRLMDWWGNDDNTDRPLLIATVDRADAARLRASSTVDLTGTPDSPYVYDLSEGHTGSIPDHDLTYRPAPGRLAALHVSFHAARPTTGGEFRYSLTDAFPVGIGFQESVDLPAERTDYVSAGPGQLWTESVTIDMGALEERSGPVRYRGGSRHRLHWFQPVWHPWLGTGLGWGEQRTGDQIQLNTPGWGDSGPDHTGFGDVWGDSGMTQTTSVYQDGILADSESGPIAFVRGAPDDAHTYRVVTDTALDADHWTLTTRGHTEWTFRSARTPDDHATTLPLINLSYGLDTDLAGTVPGGRRLPVTLGAGYLAGATGTGTLGGGRLEVSYDEGASWREVRLTGAGASWHGTLAVPGGATSVSLRASARDDRGGSVAQEIVRAVGVRQP
ncbi:S8 family serine peptidase [Streptomyces sp. SID8366]|uniref:S8 family serine peptidase n=1 Tax=unclassified Streptomyces TaxID=2593676 RepID=UPI000DBA569E|nr:S8 family serine peptidase [Streptomyces sp. PsTaAH-130]MYU08373.1 S8 family serine peptidase [Streptomyces sp. SID8366]MYU67063.1 S8 family serine peptidase [Streptomyces sp. SID69]RAJ62753.1 subtilisin family serine protease [Streptomyces sp. PsTaAH-130]